MMKYELRVSAAVVMMMVVVKLEIRLVKCASWGRDDVINIQDGKRLRVFL